MAAVLEREEAAATIEAGLCLARLLPPAESAARAGPWIFATMGERLDIPPPGVIADLGALLFGATLEPARAAATADDPALAAAIRRYEDALLGRLALNWRVASAGFAVARLPRQMHAQAVGILVSGVLARVGYRAGMEVSPGVVRRIIERSSEALQRGFATLRDDANVRRWLADAYADLARRAQQARDLIGDADLFALENLTVLGSLGQRLAVADVVRAQEAMASALPRRLPRRHPDEGDLASRLEDESAYPAGGFSSVTRSGSLENLVASELIYMDPPPASGAKAEVDPFDVRWVEGELLYYARDEAIVVRRRRLVVFAFATDLVQARVKDRELPWQRIVLVLGAVLVLTKKLVELLGEEELAIQVAFLHEEGMKTPLGEEKDLTELMLREWREKGRVDVVEATWGEVVELAGTNARRALVEVVRVAASPHEPKATALDRRVVFAELVPPAGPLDAWSRATADLLSLLL
jgi:hypothetical protein